MNHEDERDYAEERANAELLRRLHIELSSDDIALLVDGESVTVIVEIAITAAPRPW